MEYNLFKIESSDTRGRKRYMKIGIVFQDGNFKHMDFRFPEKGNPGVGGSEFLFLLLMRYMILMYHDIEFVCYHFSDNLLPEGVDDRKVENEIDSIFCAQNEKVDYLIHQVNRKKQWYETLDKGTVAAIAWAHCYISKDELEWMTSCSQLKRIVCVGKEQYDTYIDHPAISKMQYIYNMLPSIMQKVERKEDYKSIVTYAGSITPGKGFHILAKQWKKIVRRVPNAELYVLGNGTLYDRNSRLGSYGIAEETYERKFMRYLLDDEKIMSSVHFCGVVGQEKDEIYRKTAVGIINPSAKTETFGMAAVEMSAYGIPIATKGKFGLLDTVIDGQTGLLSHSDIGFRKNVIRLLLNNEMNDIIGKQGYEFVTQTFAPNLITSEWYELFVALNAGQKAHYQKPQKHFWNDFKWLRIFNRFCKEQLHMAWLPAVCQIKRTY